MINRWSEYIKGIVGDAKNVEVARKVDIDPSLVGRWKGGDTGSVAFVVKFARSYNRNVLEALAAAEMITDEEAALHEVKVNVEDLTTEELAEELVRRTK
jgi:hypothetical protein